MYKENEQKPLKINIAVENFGPIEKADIDLRPLTVFVGESNTGKTYLATLIYVLQQTFEGFSRIPWIPFTPVRLESKYIARDQSESTPNSVKKEIHDAFNKLYTIGSPFKFSDLPQIVKKLLKDDNGYSKEIETELKRCFDLEFLEELRRFTDNSEEEINFEVRISDENQFLWSINCYSATSGIKTKKRINEDMVLTYGNNDKSKDESDLLELVSRLGISMWEKPRYNTYFLPAIQGGIMETHGIITSALVGRATRPSLEHSQEMSMFTGMIADFLKHIINYDDRERSSSEIKEISKMLENDVLHGKIDINRPIGVGYPQILYKPKDSEQAIRLNRSSSMVSELAPLVLFLRGLVVPGDTLIIEEPEAHLHPRAQTQVAITLARLVRAGVRVIITTHSDWLLEQIGNLVREGELMRLEQKQPDSSTNLTAEEVGAWWFHTDKPVEEIEFDIVDGIEPPDYGNVAEDLYNHSVYLRTSLRENAGANTSEQE